MKKKYIKGFLEDIVLHLIDEHGQMYGYELTKKVQKITRGAIEISEGALYPVLHKLEEKELLTAHFAQANGRMRKYYRITPQGGKMAKTNAADLSLFFGGVQQIFNLKPSAS